MLFSVFLSQQLSSWSFCLALVLVIASVVSLCFFFSRSCFLSFALAVCLSLSLSLTPVLSIIFSPFLCPSSLSLLLPQLVLSISYTLWFYESFVFIIAFVLPQFYAVHLPVSPWFWQSFSSLVLSQSRIYQSFFLSLLSIFVSVSRCQFFSLAFVLSFLSFVFNHCCCLALVLFVLFAHVSILLNQSCCLSLVLSMFSPTLLLPVLFSHLFLSILLSRCCAANHSLSLSLFKFYQSCSLTLFLSLLLPQFCAVSHSPSLWFCQSFVQAMADTSALGMSSACRRESRNALPACTQKLVFWATQANWERPFFS